MKELMSLKDAKRYLKGKGYPEDELKFYTDTELRVLATHQKEKEYETKN